MILFKKDKNYGLGLVEAIVGISILLIIFIGLFGVAQLGMRLTAQSKNRLVALALANQKIELLRNLSYNQVGTLGGIPAGSIPETENIIRNNVFYTVKTTIVYVDDPFDNIFPSDPLAWDYKRIKIKVSWSDSPSSQVFLQTDVAPKGIETTGSGGIISILVFDANGQALPQTNIHVENNSLMPPINANYQTDDQGRIFIPGAPACNDCYKITANKLGYSSESTYAAGEQVRGITLANPLKPFLSVIEGQLSEVSFSIDRFATKTLQTNRYVEEKNWSDSFENEDKISEKFQVAVDLASSSVKLEDQGSQYQSSGYLVSATIAPLGLVEWGRLAWNDEILSSTDIKYQILYHNGVDWALIPDEDLTVEGIANSQGFTDSPVDLTQLDSYKYKSIRLKANFSTLDQVRTPTLFDWQITWFSSDTSIPISNIAFYMQGAKTLGTDSDGQPVYKYQENLITDLNGQLIISNLEWDSYRITINGVVTGYDIANSFPSQPVNINPGVNQTAILKLAIHQLNTLLVTVKDSANLPLVGATIRLYRVGYDRAKLSTDSGQVFYSPLTSGTYNLEVRASGYQDYVGEINISGQSEQIVVMTLP
jgi:hypothetical protein